MAVTRPAENARLRRPDTAEYPVLCAPIPPASCACEHTAERVGLIIPGSWVRVPPAPLSVMSRDTVHTGLSRHAAKSPGGSACAPTIAAACQHLCFDGSGAGAGAGSPAVLIERVGHDPRELPVRAFASLSMVSARNRSTSPTRTEHAITGFAAPVGRWPPAFARFPYPRGDRQPPREGPPAVR